MDLSIGYEYEYFNHAIEGTSIAANPKNELTLFRTWSIQASYVFNDRLSMSLRAPYRQITAPKTDYLVDSPTVKGRFTRSFSGLGDVIVMSSYRAILSGPDKPFGLSLGLGVRLPTGASDPDHEWASGVNRDAVLQTGAGSLDPIVSTSVSYSSTRTKYFGSVVARFSGGENIHGYKYSSEVHFGAGAQKEVSEWLALSLSANSILTGHDYDRGAEVGNTGGKWLYLSPGFTIISGGINTEFNFQIPLYENVNMAQLTSDYIFSMNLNCGLDLKKNKTTAASIPVFGAPNGFIPSGQTPESSPAATPEPSHKLDIITVSLGERVTLSEHSAPDKITLYEFYGDKCSSCAAFEPKLLAFLRAHPEVVLRKINIGDGESEVIKQFSINVTPTLMALNSSGEVILRHEGGDVAALMTLVK